MKAGYFLGGLALGVIIGGGVGYLVASDPRKKAKIDDFLADVGDKVADLGEKVNDIGDKVKAGLGLDYCDNLTEEEIIEIEAALAAEMADDLTDTTKKTKSTK